MTLNLLAVNIGNTHVRLGVFQQSKLVQTLKAPAHDGDQLAGMLEQAYQGVAARPGAPVVLASTAPPATQRVAEMIQKNLRTTAIRIEHDLAIPIGRRLDPEAIVGEDRLLNAAAAFDALKQACVIIDAGTAVTVDLVDGEGTFHGGAIMPGATMMLRSLGQGTAQLPEVEMERPVEAVGHNTVEAMRTGVYFGLRGAVRMLTETFAEQMGFFPMVVATGGDAEMLYGDDELVERIVPDLTLLGMMITLRSATQADS